MRVRKGHLSEDEMTHTIIDVEQAIANKAAEVAAAMRALGRRIKMGDESEIVHWVAPNTLACVHRPFRYHPLYGGSRHPVPKDATGALVEWADLLRCSEARSILSLMHDGDLACYSNLDLGASDLIGFLQKHGFVVAHVPYEDPAHKQAKPTVARKTLITIRELALAAYDALPKPVAVQCSAGEDRSAPVAAFIWAKRLRSA
jgi:hypothetical protein